MYLFQLQSIIFEANVTEEATGIELEADRERLSVKEKALQITFEQGADNFKPDLSYEVVVCTSFTTD